MTTLTQTVAERLHLTERLATARTTWAERRAAWRTYRQTERELSSLRDAELLDLGISRADIPRISREAAGLR